MARYFLLVSIFFMSACAAHVQFAKTGGDVEGGSKFAPTKPETIKIYSLKSKIPGYTEIGLITFSSGYTDMAKIYEILRLDGAKRGAHIIAGLKFDAETHTEAQSSTSCDSKGVCRTSTNNVTVMTTTVSGTLFRKAK
jgi:hypothetical protein